MSDSQAWLEALEKGQTEFVDAWKRDGWPHLGDYLPASADPQLRRRLLLALMPLDWEFRWKAADDQKSPATDDRLPPRPKIEDYAALFPELLNPAALTAPDLREEYLRLICDEYENRRQEWGDFPALTDYVKRFGDHFPDLASRLKRSGCPDEIEHYRVGRPLGDGKFGRVYLAHDPKLDRRVAIKVPHPKFFRNPEKIELLGSEARTVAQLEHEHIVRLYYMHFTDEIPVYLVFQYINGVDLARWLESHRPDPVEAARVICCLCRALDHAHRQKPAIVHRDIKPTNILMQRREGEPVKPWIVDFGLAITERELGTGPDWAGTRSYMSPEQLLGYSDEVPPSSDVYSLGIILWEMLAGPEQAKRWLPENERDHRLRAKWPLDEQRVPDPLRNICGGTLEFHETDRLYRSAGDMAEALQRFLDEASTGALKQADDPAFTLREVGLRSFDEDDWQVYPKLLPPRDYDGLPESIAVWKRRIKNKTFAVALIYGPSGCGKSSLVKAGLLPRLSSVTTVDIEATSVTAEGQDTTERRLLWRIRERFRDEHNLTVPELDLVQTIVWLRERRQPTLLVLDQFEQWLSAYDTPEETELYRALRRCDKQRVRCLLLVRDESWRLAERFLAIVAEPPHHDKNYAAVKEMPLQYAREVVLPAQGRSLGRLPSDLHAPAAKTQAEFVRQAVEMLAERSGPQGAKHAARSIVCVKLALFADMLEQEDWTADTLKRYPTFSDIGQMYLERYLGEKPARPQYAPHIPAARRVLELLSPKPGEQRAPKPLDALREASGYRKRPEDFQRLLDILDLDLKLITVVKTVGVEAADGSAAGPGDTSYQLTHDFLVPSLREWLESKLTSAERELRRWTPQWTASHERISRRDSRFLPSLGSTLRITWSVRRRKQTDVERALMRAAQRYYAGWVSVFGACVTAALLLLAGVM